MPRYYSFKIADHYLYFTSQFVIEAMHAHAIGKNLSEARSARFFIKGNGDIVLRKQGTLNGRQMVIISKFIKENYLEMYKMWQVFGCGDFLV